MKILCKMLTIAALLPVLSSCFYPRLQTQEARAGLDAAVAQLPKLGDFDTVKVVYQEFCRTDSGCTSCYARAYVIIGSSLTETKALDVYVGVLKSLGWVARELQYDTERTLMRGEHELALLWSGEPGVNIADAVDYTQLRAAYESIIFVRLDFRMPGWDQC